MEIQDVIFDSYHHFLFTFSERYSQNISPRDEEWDSFSFDDEEIKEYNHQVKVLNENKDSDQAIFILNLKH